MKRNLEALRTTGQGRLEVTVNHNGTIQPAAEATIPALDHGFLYGDSVYETLRTFRGKPFLLERHLDRLERSLSRISLELPVSRAELASEILRTLAAAREPIDRPGEVASRIVVTRGVGPIGLDITLCEDPRYLIYAFPIRELPESYTRDGIAVVVSRIRRNHPSALDPGIKSGNFLNNILAYRDAKTAGAQEALLLNAEGYLAEGTTSNVFVVREGRILTPGAFGILEGITRAVVLEEARRGGLPVDECQIPAERLLDAEEAFITSSIRGIVPVTRVNGRLLGEGRPGPVTRRLMALYDERIKLESA